MARVFRGRSTGRETRCDSNTAAIISTIAQGVLGGSLDWSLIGEGAVIGVAAVIVDEVLKRSTGKRLHLPPLAIGMGIGSELRKPLGVAIVGGLVVSQILTLYTTPVIYLALDQLRQRKKKRTSHAASLRPIGWPPMSESPAR